MSAVQVLWFDNLNVLVKVETGDLVERQVLSVIFLKIIKFNTSIK